MIMAPETQREGYLKRMCGVTAAATYDGTGRGGLPICNRTAYSILSIFLLRSGNPRREPGAVVCRASPSFIRFGTFQLPSTRPEDLPLVRVALL